MHRPSKSGLSPEMDWRTNADATQAGGEQWLGVQSRVTGNTQGYSSVRSEIHTYIHTCIHTCIHTYIHKYINTFICIYKRKDLVLDVRTAPAPKHHA